MINLASAIADELNVKPSQIDAAITLLDDGATVPFIARYRKEVTQGLDDSHLRHLEQRLTYLRELENRRAVILTNIEQQGKLTPSLSKDINAADNKTRLEDLYLPFKPKRRTKGEIAKEAGLEPLANDLYNNWALAPEAEASKYINADKNITDEEQALEGASYILIERFSEDANLLQKLRRHIERQAHLTSKVVKKEQQNAKKYRDYFEHSEKLVKIPSHRVLAMLRGRNEGFLRLSIDVDPNDESANTSSAEQIIIEHYGLRLTSQPAAKYLNKVVRLAWKAKLSGTLETEFLSKLKEEAEAGAIKVFASNLSDVLMAAPAGAKVTLGLDPGLRTGCKFAVVDATGKLLHTATIFPHAPQNHWDKSVRTLVNVCKQYKVELVAIGNGTGSRETDKLVADTITALTEAGVENKPNKLIVSEAGASVYSASELASQEFPNLDVSIRGAVSIARRLQDPLAELVKIDPKAIGVGQYQHDVSQSQLSKTLDDVIEDCVNAVGVDLNSASTQLLSRVSGLNKTMAQNIVLYREEKGRFDDRKELKKVARLGPKAFEQAAGFLRIREGNNPLDQSGVHPESYAVVEKILANLSSNITEVIGDKDKLSKVDVATIVSSEVGEITLKDIINELEKPGRDPRPEFKTATFADGVNTIKDLREGMILEGVISNVANFGAFVDIGVHQDGLVHISSITDKFISDPREVVKAGEIVKVKVTEVDVERKRIGLTMRLNDTSSGNGSRTHAPKQNPQANKPQHQQKNSAHKPSHSNKPSHGNKPRAQKKKDPANAAMGNAFADAFAKLKK